jgi:hypothetical protein
MKKFFLDLINKNAPQSSKRFFGGIVVIVTTIMICVFKQEYLRELLYTGAGLLGLGIFDKTKRNETN